MKQNAVTFKGRLHDIRLTKGIAAVLVSSIVAGKMKTDYPVIMSKDVFEKTGLDIGDEVAVLNSFYYLDGAKPRFRVSCPGQIVKIQKDDNSFSYATFSGSVTGYLDEGKAKEVFIEESFGERKITYLVVMSRPLSDELDFGIGDIVAIQNAQCYQKNGKFRFQVAKKSQVGILKRASLDRGIVKAEDKFI